MENEQYHSSLALRERKTVKKVAFILDHGADINQKDQDGNVILHDVLKHRYSIKTIQRLPVQMSMPVIMMEVLHCLYFYNN